MSISTANSNEGSLSASGYREANRSGWALLSRNGSESSCPYGPQQFAQARSWLDPSGWLPWRQIRSVLCLACGGGQQGPLFASLGYDVTVVDLSPEQLHLDGLAARNFGFEIECIESDMADLS